MDKFNDYGLEENLLPLSCENNLPDQMEQVPSQKSLLIQHIQPIEGDQDGQVDEEEDSRSSLSN